MKSIICIIMILFINITMSNSQHINQYKCQNLEDLYMFKYNIINYTVYNKYNIYMLDNSFVCNKTYFSWELLSQNEYYIELGLKIPLKLNYYK